MKCGTVVIRVAIWEVSLIACTVYYKRCSSPSVMLQSLGLQSFTFHLQMQFKNFVISSIEMAEISHSFYGFLGVCAKE
jgi:hypothetical protein